MTISDQNAGGVVILLKGGRLPSWDHLGENEKSDFSETHVDLMLSVADQFGIKRLEGFRLIGPQDSWQRFWLIEFPSIEGAEKWIEAEMAPPYGLYGYNEYYLSRPLKPASFSTWVTKPLPPVIPLDADPHTIPPLSIDRRSVVVLMFARYRPGTDSLTPNVRGDEEHVALMQRIAQEQGLMRLEALQLITPQGAWHQAWIIELPTLEAAEAWIQGEESLPHGMHVRRNIHLARKWAPEYFASWVRAK